MTSRRFLLVWAALLAASLCSSGQPAESTTAFTVTMPQPASHIFHVAFRCEGLRGEMQDFKMPLWQGSARNIPASRAPWTAGTELRNGLLGPASRR